MPFNSGSISFSDIRELWDSSGSTVSISLSDFYRQNNTNNWHSAGLPLRTADSDLSVSMFRNTGVPLANSNRAYHYGPGDASATMSTTRLVDSDNSWSPGYEHTFWDLWQYSPTDNFGRPIQGLDDAVDGISPPVMFANSGTYAYYMSAISGYWFRLTLSTAYDITSYQASSLVTYDPSNGYTEPGSLVSSYINSTNWLRYPKYYPHNNLKRGAVFGDRFFMKPDGTKLYGINMDSFFDADGLNGSSGDTLCEFTMSTAYDLTTLSFSGTIYILDDENVNGNTADFIGFSPDGTRFYAKTIDERVARYDLSTAWNITTMSPNGFMSATEDIQWIDFYQGLSSNKPTKAYGFGSTIDVMSSYTFTDTVSSGNIALTKVGGDLTFPGNSDYTDIAFYPFANGTKMIWQSVLVGSPRYYYTRTFSTGFRVDTLQSYDKSANRSAVPTYVYEADGNIKPAIFYSLGSPITQPFCFSNDGTKFFYLGTTATSRFDGNSNVVKLYVEDCDTPFTLDGVDFSTSSATGSNNTAIMSNTNFGLRTGDPLAVSSDGHYVYTMNRVLASRVFSGIYSQTYYYHPCLFRYNMTTAYDPSTIAVAADGTLQPDQVVALGSNQAPGDVYNNAIRANIYAPGFRIFFSGDGKQLCVITNTQGAAMKYKLQTAWDLTSIPNYVSPPDSDFTTNVYSEFRDSDASVDGMVPWVYHRMSSGSILSMDQSGNTIIEGNFNIQEARGNSGTYGLLKLRTLDQTLDSNGVGNYFSFDSDGGGTVNPDYPSDWTTQYSPARWEGRNAVISTDFIGETWDSTFLLMTDTNTNDSAYVAYKAPLQSFQFMPNGNILSYQTSLHQQGETHGFGDIFRIIPIGKPNN